jgi:hypothetical protein
LDVADRCLHRPDPWPPSSPPDLTVEESLMLRLSRSTLISLAGLYSIITTRRAAERVPQR